MNGFVGEVQLCGILFVTRIKFVHFIEVITAGARTCHQRYLEKVMKGTVIVLRSVAGLGDKLQAVIVHGWLCRMGWLECRVI
jgi:hypothetical protein